MPLTDKERDRLRPMKGRKACCVLTGELVEVTYIKDTKGKYVPKKRGEVNGFTRSARLRMLRTVAQINWDDVKPSLFITLTYPDKYLRATSHERNQDRHWFFRSIENYLGKKVGALWRLEWVPRKSGVRLGQMEAHVHLIVFDVKWLPAAEVNRAWRVALGADGYVRSDVKGIKNGRRDVAKYVSKYCSKCSDRSLVNSTYLNAPGRHWGLHRKDLIPFADRFLMSDLTPEEIRLLENAACMTFKLFTRGTDQGFSLFGKNGKKIGEEILLRHIDNGKGFD
jgi:hypothetical protein